MRRRLLYLGSCLIAVLIAAIAALPWWLEPVLRRVGRTWNADFGTYERIGYTRFALHDVKVLQAGVRVTVSRVEAYTPLVWLWNRFSGRSEYVFSGPWSVIVEPRSPISETSEAGWMPLRARLLRIVTGLDHWLPQAKVGAGSVHWPGGGLTLETATWSGRTLIVEKLVFGPLDATVSLAFPSDVELLRLTARTIDGYGFVKLVSHDDDVTGDVVWWAQSSAITAHFKKSGWLPQAAKLQADAWTVPGAQLKLGGLYTAVHGSGKIEWTDGHFDMDLLTSGEPVPGKGLPHLDAALRGHGDTQSFTVDSVHATLPGITAQLSAPFTIDRQGRFKQSDARFILQADLAKQPWFTATGTVNGEAGLVSGADQSPVINFKFETLKMTAGDFALDAASIKGRFVWPRLEITSGTILTPTSERIAWRGGWNFQTKEIVDAAVDGSVRREMLARWLQEQPVFDTISIQAQISGPLANLTHEGKAQVAGVKLKGANPFSLAIWWHGQADRVEEFTADASAGTTTISSSGSATRTEMRLSGLTLSKGNAKHLSLAAPTSVRWSPALQIDALHLNGDGNVDAAVTWGETGRVDFSMHKGVSTWIEDFLPLGGPAWQVNSLVIASAWDHGPMTFSVEGDGTIDLGGGRTAAVGIAAKGDKDGLRVDTLRATEDAATILTAAIRVPIMFSPSVVPFMRIEPEGALLIDASMEPNRVFWEKLAELTGVEFKELQATAHVTGTWAKPLGEMSVKATLVSMDPQRIKLPMPIIEALDLSLKGDRSGIKLETLSVRVGGQELRAQGFLPMVEGGWSAIIHEPLSYSRQSADLRLEVPDADLSAFARLLPPYLAPKGRLQLNLNYVHGGKLDGFIRLRDAASRPLGPLGVLQEINADIQMSGRNIELRNVTAKAGGQTVTLGGTVQFPENGEPRYAVTLQGENLPFVRQTGLLVRGDLDLKLHTPIHGPTAISGTVRLRDSLFLSDVRAFLPGGAKVGVHQAPFFAVETAPFDSWTLDVSLSGAQFMRLRTPVFNGVASLRFHLGGTLGEPRAIGDLVIDEGQVLMPFASFTVKQGSVRIADENPHEMVLFLRGTGRRIGYNLSMEITGTAESPNIAFTSSPALDSEQLLLMIMTGAAPRNEISYSGSQRFARIGTYLGQSLLGSFGGDSTDADRLSISPGEKVSRQGRETYEVEYKLTDRWKWVGEYDEFDDTNIGLKWRFYPGKPKTEAPSDVSK